MQEAIEFLKSLNEKVRDKIAYNIGKSMLVLNKELFKKLGDTDIWDSEPYITGWHTGCLHSGTLIPILW